MVLADIREKECPGVYQYIVEEMYRANGLPLVKFPATVVAGYEHHRTKKRTREPSDLVQGGGGGRKGGNKQNQCYKNKLNCQSVNYV